MAEPGTFSAIRPAHPGGSGGQPPRPNVSEGGRLARESVRPKNGSRISRWKNCSIRKQISKRVHGIFVMRCPTGPGQRTRRRLRSRNTMPGQVERIVGPAGMEPNLFLRTNFSGISIFPARKNTSNRSSSVIVFISGGGGCRATGKEPLSRDLVGYLPIRQHHLNWRLRLWQKAVTQWI